MLIRINLCASHVARGCPMTCSPACVCVWWCPNGPTWLWKVQRRKHYTLAIRMYFNQGLTVIKPLPSICGFNVCSQKLLTSSLRKSKAYTGLFAYSEIGNCDTVRSPPLEVTLYNKHVCLLWCYIVRSSFYSDTFADSRVCHCKQACL